MGGSYHILDYITPEENQSLQTEPKNQQNRIQTFDGCTVSWGTLQAPHNHAKDHFTSARLEVNAPSGQTALHCPEALGVHLRSN